MLQSAWDAGFRSAWVVADEVYGNDTRFGRWLEQTGHQPYVLTVNKKHKGGDRLATLSSGSIMPIFVTRAMATFELWSGE